MMAKSKLIKLAGLLGISTMLFSCAQTGLSDYSLSQEGQQGAAVGGLLGTVAGAMLDHSNRWRGGVIGGVMGALLGGSLGQIANEASQQAAQQEQPVQYTNGNQMIQAVPQQESNGCTQVTTKYYQNGQVIKEETKEYCPQQ